MDLTSRPTQIFIVLFGLLVLFTGYQVQQKQVREANHQERLSLEKRLNITPLFVPAPNVTLFDRSGEGTRLDSYRGRVVVVNFWATWCGPCIAEMPSMIALQKSLNPEDIAFVSIAEDDSWPPLDKYLAKNPLPFDVYRDQPPRVENDFETNSYPTSFIIGRDGTALYRIKGARNWDDAGLRQLLALDGVRPAR